MSAARRSQGAATIPARVLRVCALYPGLMNIYADRGNLIVLERRCAWRGIGFQLAASGLGEQLDGDAHDLFYIGGGQDRDQERCALDLVEFKRDALYEVAGRGGVILAVCGGYQLLGRSYQLGEETLPGIGLLDAVTIREEGPRLIGNVAIEVELRPGERRVLAGFENHGGRTTWVRGPSRWDACSRDTATTTATDTKALVIAA